MFNLKQKGFTLIELLVAMGIFAIVITVVVGLFININNSQKKINEFYIFQREGGFLVEKMSREIRMAESLVTPQYNKYQIEFVDYNGDRIKYCLSDSNQDCREDLPQGFDYLLRENINKSTKAIISSSNMSIEYVKFIFEANDSSIHPLVTITMKINSKDGNSSLILQKSVALRVYN